MENNTASKNDQVMGTVETENNSNSYITKKDIESLGIKVRLSDTDESTNLELYCYTSCTDEDSILLKKCRGVVFQKDKLIMNAFPYTYEFSHVDTEKIETYIKPIFNNCLFFDSHEGTLLRLFYFETKWFISTHRKLNAFKSKWASSESFGTTFKKALEKEVDRNIEFKNVLSSDTDTDKNILEKFTDFLDKDKQYMFLIEPCVENRIVCQINNDPFIYHVGTFVNGVLDMNVDCKIKHPKQHYFNNIEEICNYVNNINYKELQGIICFTPDNFQYKIINNTYLDFFKIRGNEPSLRFRYLNIRLDQEKTNKLYYLYPDSIPMFEEIENSIYNLAKYIYNSYVQRYIRKQFVTVPTEDFFVIRACHSWHEIDRINNRISLNKVIEELNKQTPTNINRMLRRIKNEQNMNTNNTNNNTNNTNNNTNNTTTNTMFFKNKKSIFNKHILNNNNNNMEID